MGNIDLDQRTTVGSPRRLRQAFAEAQLAAPVDGTRCQLGDQGEDDCEGASNEAVERVQEVVQPDGRGPPPERLLIGVKIGLTGQELSGWQVADPIRVVAVDSPRPRSRFLAVRRCQAWLSLAPISPGPRFAHREARGPRGGFLRRGDGQICRHPALKQNKTQRVVE